MAERFRRFAAKVAEVMGTHWAFLAAIVVVTVWGLTGPYYHFSDTWQIVINTGTTIVTFLMVFVLQSTQNRDARALHLKLDELIRSSQAARNRFARLEDASDAEIKILQNEFAKLHAHADHSGKQTDPEGRPPKR